jgi:2-C-methyl-D-erythritol 4-phosphate cytidylyltransferase
VRYWVVMPAAGTGQRFGAATPKQYALLAGRRVIEWPLRLFLADARCQGIVVAVADADPHWPAVATVLGDARLRATTGGAQRSESVLRGLAALPAGRDDWVLVHDAARPCLGRAEVDALLLAVADHPVGGLLALPVADTVKRADAGGAVEATLPRERLWRAQTPQMFRYGGLVAALEAARRLGLEPTDESQALELQGAAPRLVEGSAQNIKITTPADLAFAAAVLASRENQP